MLFVVLCMIKLEKFPMILNSLVKLITLVELTSPLKLTSLEKQPVQNNEFVETDNGVIKNC